MDDIRSLSGAMSHIDTQREYIYSDLENNPIAFLIEGEDREDIGLFERFQADCVC